MAEIEINGYRAHVEETGTGPALVLVHGLGGTGGAIWKPVIGDLARDHRVVYFDLRGSGASEVTPGPYTMELLADDLAALVGALDLGRHAVIGHSLGGGIALRYAATDPDGLRAVVGVGAVAEFPEQVRPAMEARAEAVEADGMAAVAEQVGTNGLSPRFRERHPEELEALISLLRSAPPDGYAAQCRIATSARADYLESIRTPVLLVSADADLSSPPGMSRENTARIPNAALVELTGPAHIISWEQPRELAGAIRTFLADHR